MTAGTTPGSRVVFCCDAGIARGAGHVMRCIGLAEEFARRGLAPLFVADTADLPWLSEEIVRRGFGLLTGDADGSAVLALDPGLVVIDAYQLEPSVSRMIHAAGVPVVAIVDEGDGGHEADVYVNQNLGASVVDVAGTYLAGLRYALLRDAIVDLRSPEPSTRPPSGSLALPGSPRVVAFFGGTDPMGAAPIAAAALIDTEAPVRATVVAATPDLADAVRSIRTGPGQQIEVIAPTRQLPALVAAADLVVSASGTSLWEMLCLGVPAAVVCVVDNQRAGYEQVVAAGLAAGLGELDDLRTQPPSVLADLLSNPALRQHYAQSAWSTVDGRGRERVANAIASALPPGPLQPTPKSQLIMELLKQSTAIRATNLMIDRAEMA